MNLEADIDLLDESIFTNKELELLFTYLRKKQLKDLKDIREFIRMEINSREENNENK